MPNLDPDAMQEHNPHDGPPPLSDAGVVDFVTFWQKSQTGFFSNDEIAAKFQYLAPRLIRRITSTDYAMPPTVDIPPPGSQGATEINAARSMQIVDHPLVGKSVSVHFGDEVPVDGKVISFDGMLLELLETAGDTSFIPITSAQIVRIDRIEKSANPKDYEADLPPQE